MRWVCPSRFKTWIVPENAGLDWEEKAVTLDEFQYILNNELWDAGYDPDELWINSITLCDMDEEQDEETFKNWVESIKTESVTYYAPVANTAIH